MKNTVIIYGSTTGSTETVANWIKEAMEASGTKPDIFNVTEASPEMAEKYELIVLGSSTWGCGEIQDDFIDFYEAMNSESFSGKEVAVFGCGDSDMFPDCFCEAVDQIADKAKQSGAKIIGEQLKIDGDVDDYQADARDWARSLV